MYKLIFLFVIINLYECSNISSTLNYKENILRKQIYLNENLLKTSINFVKNYKSLAEKDEKCKVQITKIIDGILKFDLKSLEFIDAWGKLPSGILWGHIKDFGNFNECLNSTLSYHNINDQQLEIIRGQYCLASISTEKLLELFPSDNRPDLAIPGPWQVNNGFTLGICTPEICRYEYLDEMIKEALNNLLNLKVNETIVGKNSCIKNEKPSLRLIDWIAIIIFSIFGIIMFISSIYDVCIRKIGGNPKPLFIAFSIITNGEKLFKMEKIKSSNIIECLNGIRCLTIIWVVFGHSYMMMMAVNNLTNPIELMTGWKQNTFSLFIQMGGVSVDTFFFISGLLIIWGAFREMEKSHGKLNILMMYFHRILRLSPVLIMIVLFTVSIFKYFGNGPLWHSSTGSTIELCEKNWWSTILYINNYVHPTKFCLEHTWYLAVDTQLYFFSPIILIGLWKYRNNFILPIVILGFLSMACVFMIFMKYNFPLLTLDDLEGQLLREKMVYYPTHCRIAAWLVGIILGYYMYEFRNRKIILSKPFLIIGWIISILTLLAVLFGPDHRTPLDSISPKLESAIYESLHRVCWSIALGWIVFVCHRGYGGIVNTILTWQIWQPLGRLSYSIYLTHWIVQLIVNGNNKTSTHFSDFHAILRFWNDFGITLMFSILTVLAFESPILVIEKLIFHKSKPAKSIKSTMQLQNENIIEVTKC